MLLWIVVNPNYFEFLTFDPAAGGVFFEQYPSSFQEYCYQSNTSKNVICVLKYLPNINTLSIKAYFSEKCINIHLL